MGAEMLSAVCYLLSFARLSCAEGKTRNLLQLIQRRKKGVGGGRGWRNVIVGVSNNQELGYFGTFLRSAKEENSGKFINFLAYKM